MKAAAVARRVASAYAAVASVGLLLGSGPAQAFEFFDGRVQVHGFYEQQVRSIARDLRLSDGWDLTQWYHVLNIEIEADIAPDGVGPLDLVSMFTRLEVRYDCVWNRACGIFSSADTYGDRARRLPKRLSDGRRAGVSGHEFTQRVLNGFTPSERVIGPDYREYAGIPRREVPGRFLFDFGLNNTRNVPSDIFDVPGVSTFFNIRGVDGVLSNDAPLPMGTLADPTGINNFGGDDPAFIVFGDLIGDRCRFGIQQRKGSNNGRGNRVLPHDPGCRIRPLGLNANKPNPFRGGTTVDRDPASATYGQVIDRAGPTQAVPGFGSLRIAGDGNPILGLNLTDPALTPDPIQPAIYRDADLITPPDATYNNILSYRDGVTAANGFPSGQGELPLRPAPLRGFEEAAGLHEARGVWLPNARAARLIREGKLDSFDQNFRQAELEWNRGASQQDEKELKEFYFDFELFDSRLWIRAGKQQIVWGKTELFRTTDQFNPQDFALASLPSLEESRIALWAIRGVWSFYDVGPFEDMRLEVAMNYDQFEPADLGRCGEPYTPLPVCDKTFGLLAHGFTGVALLGERRPQDPWNSAEGIEVGARLEWRWDRFSFAFTDFYGYNDTPYAEQVFAYSRNVDPITGRPRRGETRGDCPSTVSVFGSTAAKGIPAGASDPDCLTPDIALVEHSANQTLFHAVCASSIGFTNLDTTVCGQSVFNSKINTLSLTDSIPRPASDPANPPGIDERSLPTIAAALANITTGNVVAISLGSNPVLGGPGLPPLIVTTNVDRCDGFLDDCTTLAQGADEVNAPNSFFAGTGMPGGTPFVRSFNTQTTSAQKALYGCGEFYGTNCEVDGLDLMNAEASVIMQSWTGIEGTGFDGVGAGLDARNEGTTTGVVLDERGVQPLAFIFQPGTYHPGFGHFDDLANGDGDGLVEANERRPIGTRPDPDGNGIIILPGARGANDLDNVFDDDAGYDANVDGCSGPGPVGCNAAERGGISPALGGGTDANVLYHPMAGRLPGAPDGTGNFGDNIYFTDDDIFVLPDGTTSDGFDAAGNPAGAGVVPAGEYRFVSETAAMSWNNMMTFVGLSLASDEELDGAVDVTDDGMIPGIQGSAVDPFEGDGLLQTFDEGIESDIDSTDFDPNSLLVGFGNVEGGPFRSDGCSFLKPILCNAMSAFWAITGVQRDSMRAGGNGRFGRRDFIWAGGSEAILRYKKRNVMGLSVDVAEDITKTNWSFEGTWINDLPVTNNDELDGIDEVDTFNLTVSVDRPTFINFLNANRTFFVNSQWFFQYVKGHNKGHPSNGPWNMLATLTAFTGYFQDRLNPSMTFVYDFGSNSAAFLPSVSYRFTEVFSATFGLALFSGREEPKTTAITPFLLPDRAGSHAYSTFAENGLSLVRERDEIFLRIKYTF